MQRWFASLSLACVLSIALAGAMSAQEIQIQVQPAQAQVQVQVVQVQVADRAIAMPGPMYNQNRMLQSDAIFVGRVVAIEPADVEAPQGPNQPKANYRIAVVQVTEVVHGLKADTKNVRIGYIAQPMGNVVPGAPGGNIQILPVQPGGPAIQPLPGGGFGRRPFPGNFQLQLQVGQDGLFAVSKHHKENFYLAPTSFVQRENNPGFENEVKTAKQVSKVLANPTAALKAEDKQERYTAAAVLVLRYRLNQTGAPMKSEPIDAAESKQILQAMQGGDWTIGRFNAQVPNPFELFNHLGVTQKDGYNPVNVRNQQDIATAMQKWLDENNGKFVIQKLVPDPDAKVGQPVVPGVDPAVPPVIRPPVKVNPNIKNIKNIKLQPKAVLPNPPVQIDPPEIEIVPPQAVPPQPPARRE